MDQINQLVREHLPADPSEIESHLLSHFASELGGREESIGGELQSDDDEFDIELQDRRVKGGKRSVSVKKGENYKSRARPRKPHEPKPFLSIGNIPPQKTKRLDPLKGVAHDIRQPSFLSNPNVPYNTPSRLLASRNSNMYPMSAASSEWNSVIPKQYKQKQAMREYEAVLPVENIHISAPFKHSVSKPCAKIQRPPSPGEELRRKTMAGTQMVAKVMAKQKPTLTPRSAGKLLKGKLKPMTPVVVEGPNIQRCMGIVPQQQTQSASNSRTVNRRRQIVSTMIEKNLFPTSHLRPQTVESVHPTSIASSLDENRMDEVKEEEPIESPNKTPTPVAPPPSAIVEETLSETTEVPKVEQEKEQDLTAEEKTEGEVVKQQQRSGSFFVTESEEAENAPNSSFSSFKGLDSEVASRPRTAVESQLRKVHFADVDQHAPDGTRRSRSAVARLRIKPSSKQCKKPKKEEEQGGQVDTVDTTKMAVVPKEDEEGKKAEISSMKKDTQQLVALDNNNMLDDIINPTSEEAADEDEQAVYKEEEGNTNNNGNQERRKALQVPVTDVRQGFNGRVQGEKRGRPSVGRPPIARRGQWEDARKPDPYVNDLNINMCHPGTEVTAGSRTGSYNMRKSLIATNSNTSTSSNSRGTGGVLASNGRRSRPQSAAAGGPASFLLQEKRRAIDTARPKSAAYVQHSTPGMQVESYGAQLNCRTNRPNSAACITYAAAPKSRGQKGRRTYANVDLTEYDRDLDESKRERIALAHYVQNSRTHVCEVCARSSFRCTEMDGKMKCETCSQKETIKKPTERNSGVTTASTKGNTAEQQIGENERLLMDLGNIETSLNQVQEEIKISRARNGATTNAEYDLYGNGRSADYYGGGVQRVNPEEEDEAKTPFDQLELEVMASRVCQSRGGSSNSEDVNVNIIDVEPQLPFVEVQRRNVAPNIAGASLLGNDSCDYYSAGVQDTEQFNAVEEGRMAPNTTGTGTSGSSGSSNHVKDNNYYNGTHDTTEPFRDMGDIESALNQVQQEIRDSKARSNTGSTSKSTCAESGGKGIEGRNHADTAVSYLQRPGSSNSFLENVLSMEDGDQQSQQKGGRRREGINAYHVDFNKLPSEDAQALRFNENQENMASGSNMTVYQYAEMEEESGRSEKKHGQTAGAGGRDGHESREMMKTEEGQSGGVIEGHISSYQTSLLQPYVEEVYMSDITGSTRGGQGPTLPASPYPPLCFHVNARPPPGHVYYFAYGVDMNPTRFTTYIGHEVVDRYWGLLFGFKLRFNRKGLDQDAIGFPNIESAVNSSVEGALYLLKTEELAMVDGHMGYPEYVEKVMLPVWFLNCTEPDELGVAQYCIPAVTYVARDGWTLRDMQGVSTEFAVRQCVRGADLVSPAYKEYIISQIT